MRRAEEGVHRPLSVWRDKDQALGGGGSALAWWCGEGDANGLNIVGEDAAKLIVRDLTDEPACLPQRCHPRDRIGRRPAARLNRRSHPCIKRRCAVRIHKLHPACGEAKFGDQRMFGGCQDIDNGVPNGDNVEGGCGHENLLYQNKGRALASAGTGCKAALTSRGSV